VRPTSTLPLLQLTKKREESKRRTGEERTRGGATLYSSMCRDVVSNTLPLGEKSFHKNLFLKECITMGKERKQTHVTNMKYDILISKK
jgi:hypothetical protein